MKNKPNFTAVLLFITGLVMIGALFLLNRTTYQQILTTQAQMEQPMEQITLKQQELAEDEAVFARAVEKKQTYINYVKQKAQTERDKGSQERAPGSETAPQASVFDEPQFTDDATSLFGSGETNGLIIGIDPGHQSENIDMSDKEPNGPGSSEMKMKCTTGTEGTYSGVPEYQLNLDISLLLKTALENKGYQVVLTRTDNDTAISNMERAQYVAQQGADIYVRIHANGSDTNEASGALAMAPSSNNPYVSHLAGESNRLSQCILDSYCEATGFENLGVQYYDNMTGINWSSVPVTILEMGFMTNEDNDLRMNDPSFQQTMVEGIVNGIDAYFRHS